MFIPEIGDINGNTKRYCSPMFLKSHYPEFYLYLKRTYPNCKITEGMYKFYYGEGKCKRCGKPTKFRNWGLGFNDYCSNKCTSIDTRSKAKHTMIDRYGAPTSFQCKELQEKSKQTMIDRYGCEYPMQSSEIRNKSTETCIKKYGVAKPSQTAKIRSKIIDTTLKKYGGMGFASETIKQKIIKSNLDKYGVASPSTSESIKRKIIQSHITRHGGVGMASREIRAKIQKTVQERYGVDNVAKSGIIRGLDTIYVNENIIKYDGADWICKCPHRDCTKCEEKTYITSKQIYNDRKRLGIELCTKLQPVGSFTSSLETFVSKILDKYNIKYICQTRSIIGKELDIYCPEHKIAIECNGIYWHSTKQQKNNKAHLKKYELCKGVGIQLLTIWEDWIVNTPDIVESMILAKFGIFQKRIGARECQIKYVKTVAEFMQCNHIQGSSKSNVHLTLIYNNKIVAAMEFAKRSKLSGGKNDDCWELTRFCTLRGMQIIGAASKLLKKFIDDYHPEKIVSFSSNDISAGKVYKSLGFVADDRSSPAYWYVTPNFHRYHRSNFTKSKLVARGEDASKSEFEIMNNKSIWRIYDSGHTKYTLNLHH